MKMTLNINVTETDIKKKLRENDILIWITFGMSILVKGITMFIFSLLTRETGAKIDAIAKVYEGNLLFKSAITLGHITTMIGMLILPALAMAFYFYCRRKVLENKVDIHTLVMYTQFAFFSLLLNITNDASILAGKLAGG